MGHEQSKKSKKEEKGHYVYGHRNIHDDYKFGKRLGEPGGYGYAQLVTHKATGTQRAVKVINKTRFQRHKNSSGLEMFRREMKIMSTLNHKNLVHGIESYEDQSNLYFVMELCGGGELFDRINAYQQNDETYSEHEAAGVMKQILTGLGYMHSQNIMHCDLKPDNFLFETTAQDATLKICDFGMSKYVQRRQYMSQLCGTTFYMAPEVLKGRYTYHCDVWSVGVVMFILLNGFPPFFGDTNEDIKNAILGGFKPRVQEGFGPWFPSHNPLSDQAMDMISKMLEKDPAVRISVTEALNHPWLNGGASRTPLLDSVLTSLGSFKKDCLFKGRILDVMAESFTAEELKEFKDSFAEYDTNGDGFITIDELKAHSQSQQNEALQKLMKSMDVDGDGKISYQELVRMSIQMKLLAKEERIFNVFSQLDENHDGVLTEEEIHGAIADEGQEAHRMLAECDRDGDGRIDYNEFLNMFFTQSGMEMVPPEKASKKASEKAAEKAPEKS